MKTLMPWWSDTSNASNIWSSHGNVGFGLSIHNSGATTSYSSPLAKMSITRTQLQERKKLVTCQKVLWKLLNCMQTLLTAQRACWSALDVNWNHSHVHKTNIWSCRPDLKFTFSICSHQMLFMLTSKASSRSDPSAQWARCGRWTFSAYACNLPCSSGMNPDCTWWL